MVNKPNKQSSHAGRLQLTESYLYSISEGDYVTNFITKTVHVVFAALLGVMLFTMSISLADKVFSGPTAILAGITALIVGFAVVLLGRKKLYSLCASLNKALDNISPVKMAICLGLISALTKIAFVFLFDNNADLHPDMAMYRSFAEQYATQGFITDNAGYACSFTYTAIYGLILSPLAKIFGSDTKVFTVALSVLHSVAIILLFDILKKYVGKNISFVVLFTYCILPMGLFQTQLFTHENGLLFLHVLALWLFLKAFDQRYHIALQISCAVLASVILAIGKSINAAGQVLFISFAIYAVAKIFENGITARKCVRLSGIMLVLILAFVGLSKAVDVVKIHTIEGGMDSVTDSSEVTYGWQTYLGLNYNSSGAWNLDDAETYARYREFEDIQEARQYQKNLIQNRAKDYLASPIRIPVHLFNKIKVLWGTQTLPFVYELGNQINSFVLRGAGGIVYKGLCILNGGAFLLLYMMAFLGTIATMKKKKLTVTPALHCMMAVIGVTMALMIFEVTPKYMSHLHILIFCVLAFVVKDFFAFSPKAARS